MSQLSGVSGSGKSTVLRAIEFALSNASFRNIKPCTLDTAGTAPKKGARVTITMDDGTVICRETNPSRITVHATTGKDLRDEEALSYIRTRFGIARVISNDTTFLSATAARKADLLLEMMDQQYNINAFNIALNSKQRECERELDACQGRLDMTAKRVVEEERRAKERGSLNRVFVPPKSTWTLADLQSDSATLRKLLRKWEVAYEKRQEGDREISSLGGTPEDIAYLTHIESYIQFHESIHTGEQNIQKERAIIDSIPRSVESELEIVTAQREREESRLSLLKQAKAFEKRVQGSSTEEDVHRANEKVSQLTDAHIKTFAREKDAAYKCPSCNTLLVVSDTNTLVSISADKSSRQLHRAREDAKRHEESFTNAQLWAREAARIRKQIQSLQSIQSPQTLDNSGADTTLDILRKRERSLFAQQSKLEESTARLRSHEKDHAAAVEEAASAAHAISTYGPPKHGMAPLVEPYPSLWEIQARIKSARKLIKKLNHERSRVRELKTQCTIAERTMKETSGKIYELVDGVYKSFKEYFAIDAEDTGEVGDTGDVRSVARALSAFIDAEISSTIAMEDAVRVDEAREAHRDVTEKTVVLKHEMDRLETIRCMSTAAQEYILQQAIYTLNDEASWFIDRFFQNGEPMSFTLRADKKKIKTDIVYHGGAVSNLSSGERQRVALAFDIALARLNKYPFLMIDECVGFLDAENTATVFETLDEYARDKLIIVVAPQVVSGGFQAVQDVALQEGRV